MDYDDFKFFVDGLSLMSNTKDKCGIDAPECFCMCVFINMHAKVYTGWIRTHTYVHKRITVNNLQYESCQLRKLCMQ